MSDRWSPRPAGARRPDGLLPGLGLVGVVSFVFYEALFTRGTFWFRDVSGFWAPLADSFVRVIAAGSLPFWNPWIAFGQPMLADPGYQVFYPLTWLNLVLPPVIYYKVFAFCHALGGGLGAYYLARRWGLSRGGAFVAAAAWIGSPAYLNILSQTPHYAGEALMPWVLLAFEGAATTPRVPLRAGIVLGLVAAAQVLTGSLDLGVMTAFVGLGRLISLKADGRADLRGLGRTLPVAGAVCLLLAAPQWMPALALLRGSSRVGWGSAGALYWSLHPASLLEFVAPGLLSDLPVSEKVRAALYESREPLYGCLYLGTGIAVVVASGLRRPWGPLRVFAISGFVLAILASLGRHTALYALLVRTTPLALVRYPAKFMIAVGFFWAVLAGMGLDEWRADTHGAARRAAGFGALIAALLLLAAVVVPRALGLADGLLDRGLSPTVAHEAAAAHAAQKLAIAGSVAGVAGLLAWLGRHGGVWTRGGLVALALVDLLWAGQSVNPVGPAELLDRRPRVAGLLPTGSRVFYSSKNLGFDRWTKDLVRVPEGWKRSWAASQGRVEAMVPPISSRWGLRGSYDGDVTGLAPAVLSQMSGIMQTSASTVLGLRLLQMGGVNYVVSSDDLPWPHLELVQSLPTFFSSPLRIYRVPAPLPMAYVVGRASVCDDEAALRRVDDAAFDPRAEVLLASGVGEASPGADAFVGRVEELERRPDQVSLGVEASAPAWMVDLEAFDSGWSALVDGRPASVLRANLLFRAVEIPAGRHRVELYYRSTPLVTGCGFALAGAAFCLMGWRAAAPSAVE